ncbi:uncharacterized protein [Mytilus edulis]|uniref:uncharacterized protein n=1 Tax=Mytilus edulis TaxID=6550 RepID=UPI0039EE380C
MYLLDFSVKDWLDEVNLDINQGLKDVAVIFILDQLHLTDFFSGPKCDVERYPYSPSIQGWNSECPLSMFNRPDLGNQIACHITESCTGIDCCANIPSFGLTVRPFFVLDPCDYKISYGINTENFTKSLVNYEWGKTEKISLGQDVIVFEFSIKKPPNSKKFILDFAVKVCLYDKDNCVPDIKVFDKTEIPQVICDIDTVTDLKDFSLTDWAGNLGVNINGPMEPSIIRILLQQLGLDTLLMSQSCSHGDELYSSSSAGWKNDCPAIIGLSKLPESLVCYVPDYCTGIDCCYNFDLLDLSLNINLYIDTCNYQIRGRIETLEFEISFFDYTWGEVIEERLQEIFRIKFKIQKLPDQKKFIVDLDFSVCLEKNVCNPTLTMFKDQLIPHPLCDLDMGFKSENMSLFEWMEDKGLQIGQSLSTALSEELMEYFGVKPFLNEEQCDRNEIPYRGAANGWNNSACPVSLSLPKIHSTISCVLSAHCTGVTCCVEVGKIRKSFTVYVDIDGCNLKLSFGIEKRHFEIPLINYNWGTEETFSLLSVVKLRFSIHDLQGEKNYLLNLKLSVCLEPDGACLISTSVLENFKLPKLGCDWSDAGFKIPDFSLTKFKAENSILGEVEGLLLTKLIEDLGISTYLEEKQCSRTLPPYLSSTDGWTNDCSSASIPNLPLLTGPVSCHLMDTCTGIKCCIDVEQLSRSISAYLIVDTCSYSLEIGIEKLTFKKSLLEFDFDQKQRFSLYNILNIDYSIDDLKSEGLLLVNLDLSVCFESSGSCEFTISVLKDVSLPKPLCNWQDGSFDLGFSLKNWTQINGKDTDSVTDYSVDLLLEELDIAKFLSYPMCNRTDAPYSPSNGGWNTTCDKSVDLQPLTGQMTCHISDICTGVECCIDVDPIKRSFHVFIFLDACSYRLRIGIEKYDLDISLFDYEFGIVEQLKLTSLFTITYSIYNLLDDDVFLVNMNVSVCLESNECLIQQIVLQDVYLPKTFCKYSSSSSGFSVSSFLGNKGLSISDNLNDIVITQIMNRLGITDNLQSPQCVVGGSTWVNECPHSVQLPQLSGLISCKLMKSCTTVDCCFNVDFLKRNFHVQMDIDYCNRNIIFMIEKLKFEYSLLNFQWGVKDTLKLGSALNLDYTLDDSEDANEFRVDLNVSVQFNPGEKMFQWIVLTNTILPKIPCDFNTDFDTTGFSLQTWLQEVNVTSEKHLSKMVILQLFQVLGIGRLMNEESCQRSGAKYSPAINGWKNSCSLDVSLTPLLGPISCMIPSHCTSVDCCIDVDFLDRSFNSFLDVNTCTNVMTVGIEKLVIDPISLLNYTFGKTEHFNLKGVLRITYKIDDLQEERKLVVNMNLSVCFEWSGSCLYDVIVFQDTVMPKPLCDWEADSYFTKDFSLEKFLVEEGVNANDILPDVIAGKMMEQLGLLSYLNSDSCGLEYESGKDGWIKGCFEDVVLPDLPTDAKCNILPSCLGIDCCLGVDFLQHKFKASFELDVCSHQLHMQIERYQKTLNLIDYKYGSIQKLSFMNVVKIEYIVEDLVSEKKFQINLNISLCFETSKDCLTTVHVLKDTQLPKVYCDWGTGYPQDVSLTSLFKQTPEIITDVLPAPVIENILTKLGIEEFLLSSSCTRTTFPFSKHNSLTNNCSKLVDLPNLPLDVSCHIPESCMAAQCCIDVTPINKTISVNISLDPCVYEIEIAIEALHVKKSLLTYVWGEEETFSLQGGIKLKYKVFDLAEDRMYIVDLKFELCLEYTHPNDCIWNISIFDKQKFPKPSCNWDEGFYIPGFSLNKWLSDNTYDNNATLDEYMVAQLMEEMRLGPYLKDPQCNRASYFNITQNGWNISNGCEAGAIMDLPSLQSRLSCHITNSCMGVDCCMDVQKLGLSLNFYLNLDICNNRFTVGVENLNRTISILNIEFGTIHTFSFMGLLKINYQIYDFPSERVFVANVNMSLCLESSGCIFQQTILRDTKLPKPLCDFSQGFPVKDFSLTHWLEKQDVVISKTLPEYTVDLLFHQLGMSGYLKDPGCIQSTNNPKSFGWNTLACSENISLPHLPDYVSCHLSNYCTGLQCCMMVPLLQRTFETHVLLDACAYKLSIVIEKLVINESLFDYTFNTWKTISLGNMIRLEYKITDFPGMSLYYIDMEFKVCLNDGGPCAFEATIFSNTELPMVHCHMSKGFLDSNWSISTWYTEMNIDTSEKLSTSAILVLLDTLGVAPFLKKKECSRQDPSSIFALQYQGWSTDCKSSTTALPHLDTSVITCYLDDSCNNVQCCLDVDLIDRSLHFFLNFDPCNYVIKVGIERLEMDIFLTDYQWGKWKEMDLFGILKIKFLINDLSTEQEYAISMTASVCLESNGTCQEFHILDRIRVPKPVCNWDKGFKIQDFSLSKYMSEKGLIQLNQMAVLDVLETLGVSSYLKSPSCDRYTAPFTVDNNGWSNDCASTIGLNEVISGHSSCHISEKCTAIYCCTDIPMLNITVNTGIDLDICDYRLTVSLEEVTLEYSLVDYEYGSKKKFSLFGLFDLSFIIKDLASENVMFSVNISACLESTGICQFEQILMKDVQLPKPICHMNLGFKNPNFTLTKFLSEKELDFDGLQLSAIATSVLLQELGVAPFLLKSQCDPTDTPYYPRKMGWSKDCQKEVTLIALDESTACYLYDSCTGISCCTTVEMIGRSINTYLTLDPCNKRMSIGIEKFTVNISLFDYNFGKQEHIKLFGFVGLDYVIEDHPIDRKFEVTLDLTVCLESNSSCQISVPILKNTVLPKSVCEWKSDFIDPNFSYKEFMAGKGLSTDSTLSVNDRIDLMETLGLTDFLNTDQCSIVGWINECNQPMVALPNNTEPVGCHISNTCNAIDCCITPEKIGRSFKTFINIDPCLFKLTVAIEQLQFSKWLFDYEWGYPVRVWLFGFIRMDFEIVDLTSEEQYLIDLTLSVCMETDSSLHCEISLQIFNKYKLPKQKCDWNTDFYISNFSLQNWLIESGFPNISPLPAYTVKQLFSDLNVAAYQLDTPCQVNNTSYQNGWKNECSQDITLPTLPENLMCKLLESCTNIECCAEIPLLNTTLSFYLDIDSCHSSVTVGIEKMYHKYSLLDYTYGETEHFNLLGMARLKYTIEDLPHVKVIVLHLTFSFCMESNSSCELETILNDMVLPKPVCKLDTVFHSNDIPWVQTTSNDFSLEQWYRERQLVLYTSLPEHYVSELLEQTGLTRYTSDEACVISMHEADVNGWKKDCIEDTDLPNITSYPLVCHLKSSCTKISCCLKLEFIGKTIEVHLGLNQDLQLLEIGIGKHQFRDSLLGFDFGVEHEFRLLNVFRLRYNIYDSLYQNDYLVTLEISVCWESYKPCAWSTFILKNTRLPKQPRNLQNDFSVADFDLLDWTSERSIDSRNLSSLDLLRLYNDLDIESFFSNECNNSTVLSNSWNSECLASISLPVLPSATKCHLGDTCTSISCCVEVPVLQRSFNMFMNLDACNLKLTVGIERLQFDQMLASYQWGTKKSLWLNGILRINYQIHDLQYAKKFRLSVSLEVCMSSTEPCLQHITIFDNVDMPKEKCDWRQNYTIPSFSYSDWRISKLNHYDYSEQELILHLIDETRIGLYMEESSCPNHFVDNRLLSDCSKIANIDPLDGPVRCYINGHCSSIDCCVYDEKILTSLNVFINIDSCNDVIDGGTENYKFSKSLLEFDWKTEHEIYLGGIYRLHFQLEELPGSNNYIISMDISICWDSEATCDYRITILENNILAKEDCDWKRPFLKPDFSLTKWEIENGYPANTSLDGQSLTDLLEELGISKYYESKQCNTSSRPDFPLTAEGWRNSCPHKVGSILPLPDNIVCSLSDTCTSVDCCMNVELLDKSFHIYLDIDPCYHRLTVGIEQMQFNRSLQDYSWGTVLAVSLLGVINLNFTIDDLPDDKMYIVSMNVSVCFDANSTCEDDIVNVLNNALLPKQQCEYSEDFAEEDFSLTKWMSDRNITRTDELQEYMLYQILEELDALSFMNENSCDRSTEPWGPTNDGWIRECSSYVTLPYLNSGETTCIIMDTCTGIKCCVEVLSLGMSFDFSFELDACNFQLTIRIEKFVYNESLVNYVYGTHHQFYLKGIFLIEYTVDELSASEFILSLSLGVCLESSEPHCMITQLIADKISLPKPSCDWNQGYRIQNFSLEDWTSARGEDLTNLTDLAIKQVSSDLGISKFFKSPSCVRNGMFYQPENLGWKRDCPVSTELPELHPGMACVLLSSCTEVDCCIDVDIIHHSFNAILKLDPCDEKLIVGIENFVFEISLYEFDWGVLKKLYLNRVIRMDYSIYDLKSDGTYLVNMNVSICFESSKPCLIDQVVLNKTKLAKKPCKWQTGFKNSSFSLSSWKETSGVDPSQPLSQLEIQKLEETLGIAPFLLDNACQRFNSPYVPQTDGWKTDCPQEIRNLPSLLSNMNCYIDQSCTAVQCCIDVNELGKSLEIGVKIDPCDFRLTVRIEKLSFDVTLYDYVWGKSD